MDADVASEIRVVTAGVTCTLHDAVRTPLLKVGFHVCILKNDFTDSGAVFVECFVWTC